MSSRVSNPRLAAGILAIAFFELSASAFAAAGRTSGTYEVSPTGAATYTIPIWAQRGPNGLEPHIALTYNSQSGTGYVGVGWSLSGLSSIYRCTQTYAQDPAPAPITLTTSDVFCMDGQRLRLTGGSYAVAGSTYQTEIANFAKVTAYGSAGNGPSYFEVQERDGLTYEYGNGGGSQVLASGTSTAWVWWLDKITDRAGNTLTISYTAQNGTAVPATISWTPSSHGASSYNYTMQFGYGTNVPQSSIYGYVGGTAFTNTSLLTSISVEYMGSTVKKYVLTYQQSPTTGRDELTELQECADAGATNCLAPTQFTYQSGQIGVSTNAITALSATATELKVHNDFNGDGYDDLAYCNGGTPNIIYVAFASSSGYGSPVDTGISCTNPIYGDLTGSGKDGIMAPNGTDWWYYTWNGSAFSGVDTGLAYDSTASQYLIADVNGDGLPDLIAVYQPCHSNQAGTFCDLNIDVRLNTSAGGPVSFSSTQAQWYSTTTTNGGIVISNTDYGYGTEQYGTLKALDFNGDGRQDLAIETINGSSGNYTIDTYELISDASSFTPSLITSGSGAQYGSVTFLDFNSDGCTDYVFSSVIYISGCNGTVPATVSLGGAHVIGAMDWDGDGHTDILVQNGGTIGVYVSEGDGISALQSTSIPYSSSNLYFAFDANGDGLDDLGVYASGGAVSYYLHNGAQQMPDLLSSVTDGYGNFAKPTYVPFDGGYVGSNVNSNAKYPYESYMGPLYVVATRTYNDPSNAPNGTYSRNDFYWDAWMDLQGRGFAGFGTVELDDSRNGSSYYRTYDQAFPYTGMLTSDAEQHIVANIGTPTIYEENYEIGVTELDGTEYNERYFPYVSTATKSEYGVGNESLNLLRTIKETYSYDNYGNLTQNQETVTDNDQESPYAGDSWTRTIADTPDVDTGSWCLTLSSEVQVSYSASIDGPSVTRTRQYSPDTTDCRYTQITTEPSSNSYEVTEALGYDQFGNINSDTVTGIGMPPRQSSAYWGTTGQFPMSFTDATGATTQFNYDFGYGLVSSETDPNGLTTSWQYGDGFGRLTKETRPDGTYTLYYYSSCNSSNSYCRTSQPDLSLFVQNKYYGADGSEIDERDLYENEVGAIRYNTIYNIGGKVYVVTYYDALGRVVERSVPHFSTEYDTTYSYDILNRLVEMQRPINQNDGTLQTTTYSYEGDTTTITDPQGNSRTLVHGPNGWLRETKDDLGYAVTFGYDAAGDRTSVTDNLSNGPSNPLWTGTYAFGIAPFLIGETDVDRGTWGYTVDALGERTAWTDPKGQQFHEQYDALSRPVSRTEPDLFTQWTWGSSAADHNIGKLQSICTGTGSSCSSGDYSETETYDSLGRLYQRSIAIPSLGTYTYTWQYNATTGNLYTLTYPVSTSGQALELEYAYHTGDLQSITDVSDSPNVTIWQADNQDAQGHYTQETLGNGLVTSRV